MESSKFKTSFIDSLIIEILYFSTWEPIGFRRNVQEHEFQFLSLSLNPFFLFLHSIKSHKNLDWIKLIDINNNI